MTLNLRSHEEIQTYLLHPSRLAKLKEIATNSAEHADGNVSQEEHLRHCIATNKMLLRATFGARVFRQRHGRHFKALAEFKKLELTGKQAAELGKRLLKGAQSLPFAVRLDPDKLHGLSDKEKYLATHELEKTATYLYPQAKIAKGK